MILWRCDICEKISERPNIVGDRDGWIIHQDILGESMDLCPDCVDKLVSWMRREAIIVPVPQEESE